MRPHTLLRIARWTALGGGVLLAVGGPFLGLRFSLPSFSPFVALCASLGAPGAAGWTVAAGLALLPLVVFRRRRWFCRRVCPTGFLLDVCRSACPGAGRMPPWPLRPVGGWLFLVTLGGTALGYPLFLWLDPLALLAGTANGWRAGWTAAGVAAALGLPALLLLEWLQPKLWCSRVCPLGGMQEFLASVRHRLRSRRAEAPAATGSATGLGRRALLGAGAGLAAAGCVRALGGHGPGVERVIRPPGAASEAKFGGLCVRCGSCVAACPSRILRPDPGRAGVAGWLAPVADFSTDYCREDCARCVGVCPSGALARLSAEQKQRWVMGVARIDLGLCLLANGGECTACITQCPYRALSVGSSEDGFGAQPVLDRDLCIGCGACEAFCPAQPVRAIVVVAAAAGR